MSLEIFLPFWGDPALLRLTVESVLVQENPDWTMVVVDDAYPDESVPAYFAQLDDARVRYVRNEVNQGITENYDLCRSMATQDLIMFLGCDDVLLPNFVDVVLAAHEAFPDAAIIQPGAQVIDEHGEVISTLVDSVKQRLVQPRGTSRLLLAGEDLAVSLLRGNWLYWPSLVFRTDAVRDVPFREGLPIVQDLALVLDMIYAGESLVLDPTLCFSYRRHSGSASSATLYDGRRFDGDRRYFGMAVEQAREHGWKRAERAARLRLTSRAHALTLVPGALLHGRAKSVGPLLGHAFRP